MAARVARYAALVLLLPARAVAQEQETPQPFWYISEYKVTWSKVDSLQSLIRADGELVQEAVRRGNLLDGKVLIHHTGDEHNVIIMSKYATWDAIEADPGLGPIASEMWGEQRGQARSDAYDWIFEDTGGAHRDRIFLEAAGLP